MQHEAEMLKRAITAGGARTKVVALGIGSAISEDELSNMATAPQDKNVIYVQDYSSLPDVEQQLRNVSCTGQSHHSVMYFQ